LTFFSFPISLRQCQAIELIGYIQIIDNATTYEYYMRKTTLILDLKFSSLVYSLSRQQYLLPISYRYEAETDQFAFPNGVRERLERDFDLSQGQMNFE
jgi:hypothetical protein